MQSIETSSELHDLDRSLIEERIRSLWVDRLKDPVRAIHRHATEDVSLRILGTGVGSADAPLVFEGREAVINALRVIDTNLEICAFEIVDLIIDGPKAALWWQATVVNRGTGVSGELGVLDLLETRGGLIQRYAECFDTESFRRLMAGNPQSLLARKANLSRPHDLQPAYAMGSVPLSSRQAREASARVLRAFWERRIAVGPDVVDELMTYDCELTMIGDTSTIPFARRHVGREEVRRLIGTIDREFSFISHTIEDIVAEGPRVAMRWTGRIRHVGTGAQGRVEASDHVLVRDGKVRAFTEFFDTSAALTWIDG